MAGRTGAGQAEGGGGAVPGRRPSGRAPGIGRGSLRGPAAADGLAAQGACEWREQAGAEDRILSPDGCAAGGRDRASSAWGRPGREGKAARS